MTEEKENKKDIKEIEGELVELLSKRYYTGIKVGMSAVAKQIVGILNDTGKTLISRIKEIKSICNNSLNCTIDEIESWFIEDSEKNEDCEEVTSDVNT